MGPRSLRCAAAGLLLAVSSPAATLLHYRVGIDADDDSATGCTVQVAAGGPQLAGLELILDLTVDATQPPTVVGATLAQCVALHRSPRTRCLRSGDLKVHTPPERPWG
jgi:hypothetical protein